jgi:hypothetical protein
MSPQECQRIMRTVDAEDASDVAHVIRDFPDWQITFGPAGLWSAERKLSPTHLELHCAHDLNELRAKLMQASR